MFIHLRKRVDLILALDTSKILFYNEKIQVQKVQKALGHLMNNNTVMMFKYLLL